MEPLQLNAEVFVFLIVCAVLFYQMQKAEMKTIVSLLLITVWGGAIWFYLFYKRGGQDGTRAIEVIDKENTKRLAVPEVASSNYYVKGAPKKGLRYLKQNEELLKIAKDMVFVKTFDEQKYQEMLVYMNDFQKVYMYILAERYDCKSYVPTFLDLRENILELLYQFYIVVPKTFKHIYGVSPYETIQGNITTFLKLSRRMIEVLENFCRMDLKEHYFPMTSPMPYDSYREKEKRNIVV